MYSYMYHPMSLYYYTILYATYSQQSTFLRCGWKRVGYQPDGAEEMKGIRYARGPGERFPVLDHQGHSGSTSRAFGSRRDCDCRVQPYWPEGHGPVCDGQARECRSRMYRSWHSFPIIQSGLTKPAWQSSQTTTSSPTSAPQAQTQLSQTAAQANQEQLVTITRSV